MRVDEASRTIAAPIGDVWRALTDADAVARWLPPDDMTARVDEYDTRPGGAYRMTLGYASGDEEGKSGGGEDVVSGRFTEVTPNERLVQTADFRSDDPAFAGTMTMTWTLEPLSDGVRVTVRATDVPAGISAEDHVIGLSSSLDHLAETVES